MKKVAFYTLGCKVNQYETEAMIELFQKSGYEIVDEKDYADFYIINTCTVTNLGDRKSRQFIRRAKKKNDEAIIAVVGCYSQTSPDEVEKIEQVDIILGTNDRNKIVELCEDVANNHRKINAVSDIMEVKEFEEMKIEEVKGKTRAFLKIQEGCNQYCSYCIIPYARGQIRSRKIENIISEIQKIADKGFKEIVLTGIHIASYGKDLDDIKLIDVIEMVNKIEGIDRIRLGSIEPTLITEDFMLRISKLEKVCDHFHLSLQSGSDTVLKRMNRKYTTSQFKEITRLIRRYMPNAGLTTDIIVGFPGETEDEFSQTCQFVKDIGFSRIHVFSYSPRKGTPASKHKLQIESNVKHDRSKKLIEIGQSLTHSFINQFKNKKMDILFEEESKKKHGYIEGYSTNYIRVICKGDPSHEGEILPVKINDIEDENLIGEIILN